MKNRLGSPMWYRIPLSQAVANPANRSTDRKSVWKPCPKVPFDRWDSLAQVMPQIKDHENQQVVPDSLDQSISHTAAKSIFSSCSENKVVQAHQVSTLVGPVCRKVVQGHHCTKVVPFVEIQSAATRSKCHHIAAKKLQAASLSK
jgi:hypothetical protein